MVSWGQMMVRSRSDHGQLTVRSWSHHRQIMVRSWSAEVRSRSDHGQLTVRSWSPRGQIMVSSRSDYGQLTVRSWLARGQIMVSWRSCHSLGKKFLYGIWMHLLIPTVTLTSLGAQMSAGILRRNVSAAINMITVRYLLAKSFDHV